MELNYEFLKNSKLIPADCELLSTISFKDFVEYTDYMKWEPEEQAVTDRIVICDDPSWIAVQRKANNAISGTYSCSETGELFRTSRGNKVITKYDFDGKSLVPSQTLTLDNKIKKMKILGGTQEMENTGFNAVDLEGLMDSEVAPSTVQSKAFDAKDDSAAKAKKEETARLNAKNAKALQSNIKDVELADLTVLQVYNQKYGRLIGHITKSDRKIIASTKNVNVLDSADKPMLNEEGLADAATVEAFNKDQKVASKFLRKVPVLNVKESAPGPLVGSIITMPKGGIKTIDEIRGTGSIAFDDTQTDLITMAKSKDELIFMVSTFFGGTIKESEATHEDACEVNVSFRMSTVNINGDSTPKAKPFMTRSNKAKLIQPGNYVPAKVFVTKEISKITSNEDIAAANKALFAPLFNVGTKGSRYEKMDEASKKAITKDKDGAVTSVFFGPNARDLSVVSFANDTTISNPAIPVKEFGVSKTSGKETAKLVAYDVLNPNNDYASLAPDVNPRFAKMKEAVEGMTLADCIKKVVTRKASSSSSSSRRFATNEESNKLLQAALFKGGIQGMELDIKLTATDGNRLSRELAELKYQ